MNDNQSIVYAKNEYINKKIEEFIELLINEDRFNADFSNPQLQLEFIKFLLQDSELPGVNNQQRIDALQHLGVDEEKIQAAVQGLLALSESSPSQEAEAVEGLLELKEGNMDMSGGGILSYGHKILNYLNEMKKYIFSREIQESQSRIDEDDQNEIMSPETIEDLLAGDEVAEEPAAEESYETIKTNPSEIGYIWRGERLGYGAFKQAYKVHFCTRSDSRSVEIGAPLFNLNYGRTPNRFYYYDDEFNIDNLVSEGRAIPISNGIYELLDYILLKIDLLKVSSMEINNECDLGTALNQIKHPSTNVPIAPLPIPVNKTSHTDIEEVPQGLQIEVDLPDESSWRGGSKGLEFCIREGGFYYILSSKCDTERTDRSINEMGQMRSHIFKTDTNGRRKHFKSMSEVFFLLSMNGWLTSDIKPDNACETKEIDGEKYGQVIDFDKKYFDNNWNSETEEYKAGAFVYMILQYISLFYRQNFREKKIFEPINKDDERNTINFLIDFKQSLDHISHNNIWEFFKHQGEGGFLDIIIKISEQIKTHKFGDPRFTWAWYHDNSILRMDIIKAIQLSEKMPISQHLMGGKRRKITNKRSRKYKKSRRSKKSRRLNKKSKRRYKKTKHKTRRSYK